MEHKMIQRDIRPRWILLSFLFSYAIAIVVGRKLMFGHQVGQPTFAPSAGLYFSFLLISPKSQWRNVALLALVGWTLGNVLSGATVTPMVVLYWIGRSAATFMGVAILRQITRKHDPASYWQGIALVMVGGVVVPALAAIFIAPVTAWDRGVPLLIGMRYQFAATSLGILIIAPLIVAGFDALKMGTRPFHLKSAIIDFSLLSATTFVAASIFVFDFLPEELRLPFLILPFLIGLSTRGKPGLTALSNLVISGIASYRALDGDGFAKFPIRNLNGLTVIQLFVGTITLTHLLLTAAVYGRKQAMAYLDAKKRELETVNRELEEARVLASQASESKSRFLANMSHEIRSPLGAMVGFSDLILTDRVSPGEQRRCVEIIKRNGLHLAELVNQILDLSKVEAGRFEVEKRPVVIRELLEGIATLMRLKASEKGIALEVKVSPDTPVRIVTDSLRLRQILINAIGNAVKFTHAGEVIVRVQAQKNIQSHWILTCEIEDTGIGLSPEEQLRLFQVFSQADSSIVQKYGGTGLGLALSRHLARLLGGDFELLQSEKGVGSVFRLNIDGGLAQPAEKEMFRSLKSELSTHSADSALHGVRVLLADDAADNRLLVSRLLELSGAVVTCVEDGKLAVEHALTNEYDVILMDVEMPQLDGIQAVRQLRARGYSKPVLALTGHGMRKEIDECLDAGFDFHMLKPIVREILISSVANLTGRTRSFPVIPAIAESSSGAALH